MDISKVLMPHSTYEAKQYLLDFKNAKILAGGTDLYLDIKRGKSNPKYLISLNNIKELNYIKEFEYNIVIGSTTTFSDLKDSTIIKNNFQGLYECAKTMGAPQVRNVATIGGNIINAASAADSVPCLLVLNALLVFEGVSSRRLVKCNDYFENYSSKKIRSDEILTEIIIDKKNGKDSFYKLGKRNSLAISRINIAIYTETENERIFNFRISLGATDRYPFRIYSVEKVVEGKEIEYLLNIDVINLLKDEIYNRIQGRSSMPFKKEAIVGVYKEAINNILNRD